MGDESEHRADSSLRWIPALPRGFVERARADALLDQVLARRVVLLCAPAGSGKTLLASSWARRRTVRGTVAWVDCGWLVDTPAAFWEAVVAALLRTGSPEPATSLRHHTPPTDTRDLLDALLTWLADQPSGITLVCDDFQRVTSAATHRDLQYFIDHLPERVGLMLLTRTVPQLALYRARVEDRLVEVRGAELAFDRLETAELVTANGVGLADAEIERLHTATEGWAAGLRLAMISLRHTDSPATVIDRLSTTNAAVSGYLTEQVLSQLDPADREFLYATCVLDTLTGELAEALTGLPNGLAQLQRIADHVGFLTRATDLDDSYRYHPMFAENVRGQLRLADPARLAEDHRRAARALYEHGEVLSALRHAVFAGDWKFTCEVLGAEIIDLGGKGHAGKLAAVLGGLPADVLASDPRAQLASALVSLLANRADRAVILLDLVAQQLATGALAHDRRFAASYGCGRALLARVRGDAPGMLRAVDTDLPDLPAIGEPRQRAADESVRVSWQGHRTAALLWSDQLETAAELARRTQVAARATGANWHEVGALGVLAVVAAVRGDLATCDLRVAEFTGALSLRNWSTSPYLALADMAEAWTAIERCDPPTAGQALARAEERWTRLSGGFPGYFQPIIGARLALTRAGESEPVTAQLAHAAERGRSVDSRLLRRLHRFAEVEAALAVGDLDAAAAAAAGGSPALRVWVSARAGVNLTDASGARLAPEIRAQLGDDQGMTVRTVLAVAVQRYRNGDPVGADKLLSGALDAAERHGFRRPFTELATEIHPVLVGANLSTLRHGPLVAELLGTTAPNGHDPRHVLVDSLTRRELDILRHLATRSSLDEIAARLFISGNTVRTHAKNVYRKLAVNSRREAVLRAADLGLL